MSDDFGVLLSDMDIEAAFNIRKWLQDSVEKSGAEVVGKGVGMGVSDLDIVLEGFTYNIAIKPLSR